MDLTGIGVLLIGIALLVLAIFFARVLNNLANVIGGIDKTIEQVPHQMDQLLNETNHLIHNSNDTLADVNEKLGTLTPYFHIVGDLGESTRTLTSSLADVTATAKNKLDAADETMQNKRLGGVYGTMALSYYLWKKRKEFKTDMPPKSKNKLYRAGEIRALELEHMKEEVGTEVK